MPRMEGREPPAHGLCSGVPTTAAYAPSTGLGHAGVARNCYPSTTLPPTDSTAGQLRALLANAQRGAASPHAERWGRGAQRSANRALYKLRVFCYSEPLGGKPVGGQQDV